MSTAEFVTEVTVVDPDSQAPVEVAIFKDVESGAMFGIDSSYILTLSEYDPVNSPFSEDAVYLLGVD